MSTASKRPSARPRFFAVFEDVGTWAEWNTCVERMELNGPFAAGHDRHHVHAGPGPAGLPFDLGHRGQGVRGRDRNPGRLRHSSREALAQEAEPWRDPDHLRPHVHTLGLT